MKIFIEGMWHLGLVTSACLTKLGHEVVCRDDPEAIANLALGIFPVAEPLVSELITSAHERKLISFTSSFDCIASCDLTWICYDTPIDSNDEADPVSILAKMQHLIDVCPIDMLVIISSQLPVGSCRILEEYAKLAKPDTMFEFLCIPENLRLGSAVDNFLNPDRIVVGIRNTFSKKQLADLFGDLADMIIYMSIESAEMSKHALNTFLATSVVLTNEIAGICESTGADAVEVARALRSDSRIGPKAYVLPGLSFSGGTLARDVNYLTTYHDGSTQLPLLASILKSNDLHKQWLDRVLRSLINDLTITSVGILGLTYKPGTDTLRRSLMIEILENWAEQGYQLYAYDPSFPDIQQISSRVSLCQDITDVLRHVQVLVISTPCDEFKDLMTLLKHPNSTVRHVIDPSRILIHPPSPSTCISYHAVGYSDPL